MNDRRKWIVGFIVTLTLALIAGGAAIIYKMDAAFLRRQIAQQKGELEMSQNELTNGLTREEAFKRQITELEDKLQAAQEALDNMDLEMRHQKERLDLDFQEQFDRERRKVKELRAINDRQREGAFEAARGKNWMQSLEQLKTENPERYQRIMAARERRQQQEKQNMTRRNEILDQLEASNLSEEKKGQLQRYRELVDKMWQYRQNAATMTNEEQIRFFRENRNAFREMNDLNANVRDELFDQAVKAGKTEQAKEVMELFPVFSRSNRRGNRRRPQR